MGWYDRKVCRVRDLSCGDTRIFLELEVRRIDCRRCGKVKRERLDFLADNPLYTKRFAYYVGRVEQPAYALIIPSKAIRFWLLILLPQVLPRIRTQTDFV